MKRAFSTRISILVPFQLTEPRRVELWTWLRAHWEAHLPDCEIIVGVDKPSLKGKKPFSKTAAVNSAFGRSSGDVIVILDADALLDAAVIEDCAKRLRKQRAVGVQSWFIPYQPLHRLTEDESNRILAVDPADNVDITVNREDPAALHGRNYGAMIQIMPREAFLEVGGMDERFRGWGGEDIAFVHAVDTLWGRHRNTPNTVVHLWHPATTVSGKWTDKRGQAWTVRMWEGQKGPRMNDRIASRYSYARFQPDKMRRLVDEANPPFLPGRLWRSMRMFWSGLLSRLSFWAKEVVEVIEHFEESSL